jgi:hypothetical protein
MTIHFVRFDDYVGHELALRVTGSTDWNPPDPAPYEEIFRTGIVIPAGEFSLHGTGGATTCLSVHVDFFVDANDNGAYDAPPTDHAWWLYSAVFGVEQMKQELTVILTRDPNSCMYVEDDLRDSCQYLDIEWPEPTRLEPEDSRRSLP